MMAKRGRGAKRREEHKRLRRRIANAEVLALLYLLCATVVLTCAFGMVLQLGNHLWARAEDATAIVLRPNPVSLYMIGGLAAFLTAGLFSERVHKWLLGPPPEWFCPEYIVAALPSPRFRRFIIACLTVTVMLAALNIRKHAIVNESFVIDQLALSAAPKRYTLAKLKSIEMARYYIPASKYSGARISEDRALYLKFVDGEVWSPAQSELQMDDPSALAQAISSRSQVAISYPNAIENLPDEESVKLRARQLAIASALVLALGLAALGVARRHNLRRAKSQRQVSSHQGRQLAQGPQRSAAARS
jgi:hypothetical protein